MQNITKFHAPANQTSVISNEGVLVILRFLTRNLSLTLDESSNTMMTEMSTTPSQMTSSPSGSVVTSLTGVSLT